MGNKVRVLVAENPVNGMSATRQAFLQIENVEILPLATDGEQAIRYLNCYDVDLLVIDLMLSKYDGIAVLKNIRGNLKKKPPKIVLCTAISSEMMINKASELGAIYCMLRPISGTLIAKRSMEVYFEAEQDIVYVNNKPYYIQAIKTLIVELLRDIGVPPQLLGHEYMRSAILLAAQNHGYLHGVTTKLYPEIASIYNIPVARVERSIRTAIESTWNRSSVNKLDEIFGFTIDVEKSKPTNSEFIARMLDLLLIRCA